MNPVLLDGGSLPRLLAGIEPTGLPASLAAHERDYGPMPRLASQQLIAEVGRSGLRGRGGADFPTARKLEAVAGRRAVSAVVVNGSETEPASQKDRVLMTALPHLVIDGAVAAAEAVGAREVIIKLGPNAKHACDALLKAISERDQRVPVSVIEGPEGYVAGEESAVINHLAGGPAIPKAVPPRPYEKGYRGKPTLVQNPETLAQLALIARFGAGWYRELGSDADPGTVLTTITGAVAEPGVYEMAFGTPLRELLDAAGGPTEPIQAFLIGGYFGNWVRWQDTASIALSREELTGAGLALGSGVLIALGQSACGLHESARLARYLADESAGQCGPCVHGLAAMADAFAGLVDGRRSGPRANLQEQMLRWADEIRGRGACHHPNGATRLIVSSLHAFAADIAPHAGGACHARPAGLPGLTGAPRRAAAIRR
jgi:NADH:ubiquinone oxidoreductase subunit F (NADH-binding)